MGCIYLVEILQVKIPSPLVKDDGSCTLHFILIYYGILLCEAIKRGIEGVHFEFHYE